MRPCIKNYSIGFKISPNKNDTIERTKIHSRQKSN